VRKTPVRCIAERSLDDGFDICEIHGGPHGYVIQAVLSPDHKRRQETRPLRRAILDDAECVSVSELIDDMRDACRRTGGFPGGPPMLLRAIHPSRLTDIGAEAWQLDRGLR